MIKLRKTSFTYNQCLQLCLNCVSSNVAQDINLHSLNILVAHLWISYFICFANQNAGFYLGWESGDG